MEEIFAPVEGGRISLQIVQQIQDAIRSGRLKSGDRLPPERDLAERFGVSRVTMRDALRNLEVLGLIQIRVGAAGGAFVTSPGAEVVAEGLTNLMLLSSLKPAEIAEARLVLELGSAALAAVRATDEDIDALRTMVREAQASLADGTYERSMSLRFHLQVAQIARNKAIRLFTESFRGPLSMHSIRTRESRESSFALTVQEHEGIAKAIEERDAREAQRRMAEHLTRSANLPDDTVRALLGSL
ncbi:MAG TPA: FCD domain-containing protein [Actinomycetes bacterium]|jgi:DNA-binding FadR family transcriptional regulator|nr:FCD domain-containing protein [Actinomycetes bacterium]